MNFNKRPRRYFDVVESGQIRAIARESKNMEGISVKIDDRECVFVGRTESSELCVILYPSATGEPEIIPLTGYESNQSDILSDLNGCLQPERN